ncbi:MAG: metallophosphoesterase family protein [Spirochaetes bacterium]|nr:metallophosphoesterase family protein [Spirochaetota bacterium]
MIDDFRMVLVSDSHGDLESQGLRPILLREEATILAHLGDLKEGGGGADDSPFLAGLLDARPELRFIHVNGGRDFAPVFRAALARHPDAKSRQVHGEGRFLFVHELGPRDGAPHPDLWNRLAASPVPPVVCHGHTHRQALGRFRWPLDARAPAEPLAVQKGLEIPLESGHAWCLNPGAFNQGEYAILICRSGGLFARFQ